MKNTFKYIIAAAAFSAFSFMSGSSAFAQNLPDGVYLEKDGLAYRKSATLVEGTTDRYRIDLEAFVTGEVTVKNTSIPADIVLVLDVSGSMDDPIRYNETESKTWTASNIGSETYYYYYNNTYCPVEIYSNRLVYEYNSRYYYLGNNNGQSYTGVLYSPGESKMDALKSAVEIFIDQIHHNDLYDDDGIRRKDKEGNDTSLGNQISIVKFAADRYCNAEGTSMNSPYNYNGQYANVITAGNHKGAKNDNRYNYTEVLAGFTLTDTDARIQSLKDAIGSVTAGGATAADFGMMKAQYLLASLGEDRSDAAKTVVMFTDGEPNHGSGFDSSVASQTIGIAKTLKSTYNATVFTVGVFDSVSGDLEDYMNYTSSNYPDASNMSQPGNPVSTDATKLVYYQNASGADLSAVFKSIADVSGGSGNTEVTAESTVTVDVVASSFALPEGVQASDITVKVAPCTGWSEPITYGGETKKYLTFGTAKEATQYSLPAITPSVDKASNTVSTEGFDFSYNWCGYDEDKEEFHGYKQIISFEITVAEGAVGGPNVATNDKKSGIYVNGKQIAEFNRPSVKIPVSIWIKKKGLVGEDTAVFTISYANYQSGVDPMTLPSTAWKNFTKVMITSESPTDPEDGCPMEKLVGLDPDYFYRIKEDAWAWSYSYQDDGIQYTVGENLQNPFIFVNVPKEDIKEGESSIRNVFKKKEKTTTEDPEQPGGGSE